MPFKQWFLTVATVAILGETFSACSQQNKAAQNNKVEQNAANNAPAGASVVRLHRWVEPREQALTVLVPEGWIAEGGVVRIDPRLGPTNSVGAKLDVAIKSDQAGSVMVHWLPNFTYKDPRALVGGNFPIGSNYMGALVYPLPDPLTFLSEFAFRQKRTQPQNVQVVERKPLPELARKYQQQATVPTARYEAAALTVAYDEGGVHYLERMMAVIENLGLGIWTNHDTLTVRAPAAEFKQKEALLAMIIDSVVGNPQWVAGENRGAADRARRALETQRYLQDQRRQMVENRREVNAEIRHSNWLFITGQDDYVNPHTGKVEQGSNEYKHRWENSGGDVIYTNNPDYDPGRDNTLQGRTDYKITPLRPR